MKARILAAFVLGPPFIYAVWKGGTALALLMAAIALLSSAEMLKLGRAISTDPGPRTILVMVPSALLPLLAALGGMKAASAAVGLLPVILTVPALYRGTADGELFSAAFSVAAVVYCGFIPAMAVSIGALPAGGALLVVLFVLVWMQDTAAYFVGISLGRHKMSRLSPKKSWEGAVSGLLAGVVVAFLVAGRLGVLTDRPVRAVVLLVCSALSGQIGDLFESMLKRDAGIKDSGGVIPGHGGLLDRFDSFLGAVPMFYLVLGVLGA